MYHKLLSCLRNGITYRRAGHYFYVRRPYSQFCPNLPLYRYHPRSLPHAIRFRTCAEKKTEPRSCFLIFYLWLPLSQNPTLSKLTLPNALSSSSSPLQNYTKMLAPWSPQSSSWDKSERCSSCFQSTEAQSFTNSPTCSLSKMPSLPIRIWNSKCCTCCFCTAWKCWIPVIWSLDLPKECLPKLQY